MDSPMELGRPGFIQLGVSAAKLFFPKITTTILALMQEGFGRQLTRVELGVTMFQTFQCL